MKVKTLSVATILLAGLFASQASIAEPQEGMDKRRKGPPPEAFTVCEGRSAGEQVSFETPRGDTLQATCEEKRGRLVAVPEGHKPMHGKGEK